VNLHPLVNLVLVDPFVLKLIPEFQTFDFDSALAIMFEDFFVWLALAVFAGVGGGGGGGGGRWVVARF